MDYIKDRLKEKSTWFGLVMIISSIVVAFTPEHIDVIIEDKIVPHLKMIIEVIFGVVGGYNVVTPSKT